ncbi:MAG TPA: glycosyltransferase [Anaerolineae bacterium]|nr:glycosyltransferase [Anaerolineae bacterium]
MSNILMLTPQIPYPPRQGTALRNWGLLRGLAAHHAVSLLTFAAPDQDLSAPAAVQDIVARVAVFPQPMRTPMQRVKQLLTDPRPDLLLRLESPEFRETLRAWLADTSFDWVQVEGLELTGYLAVVWECARRPRVTFDDHNCEYLLQQRACRADLLRPTRWAGAAYSAVQWRRLRQHEANICRRADLVVTVSEADAAALRGLVPGLTPLLVPNGIYVAEYAAGAAPADLRQPAFVFTGTMNFRPNVDGVLWFVEKVWPQVRSVLPEAHFYVVGRQPHARLEALRAIPGVVITGAVPDTRPYIQAATVYVAPLLVGGGTRLKLLESTAMGKAVVSTTLGAEGFPDAAEAMLLADDPATFAAACIQLAESPIEGAAYTQQACAFAARYDWENLLPPLLARLAS